jgi:hypothetical protein
MCPMYPTEQELTYDRATTMVWYSKEEFARRGNEIYERQSCLQVEAGNHGKIVAIDIETGAYEMAEDVLTASDRLLACYPDAQAWFVRIGARAVHRFGPHCLTE